MKKVILVLLCATAFSNIHAQANNQQEVQKINTVVTRVFDAISSLDFDLIKQCSTPDLVILENGTIWNTDSIINRLQPLKQTNYKRTNNLKFIKTEVNGNTGWVFYDNTATVTVQDKVRNAHWLESAVLVKVGNDWKIKLLHSTVIQH